MQCWFFLICVLPLLPRNDAFQSYKGHQLFRIHPKTSRDLETLKEIQMKRLKLEFWTQPVQVSRPVDIMVSPEHRQMLHLLLKTKDLNYHISVPDVESAINEQTQKTLSEKEPMMSFARYHTLDEIYDWYGEMATTYPGLVTLISIGNSCEGRPLVVLKISSSVFTEGKNAVWLDAGIHSNEWVGPSTVLYFIYQLLMEYETNGEVRWLVDNLDWYLLPVFNPDGYVYTWTHDRMWRKNRANYHNDSQCKGVDLNRNWDFRWGEGDVETDPCDRMYVGPHAFSEPEVRAVSGFLASHNTSIALYMTYHSFSQLWMLPYSYSSLVRPYNYDQLMNISKQAVSALENVHGTQYYVGSVSDLVGETAGASLDYVYDTLNIPYSFGIELRDTGYHGTLLPPEQILPNAEESWAAVKEVAHYLIDQSHSFEIPLDDRMREMERNIQRQNRDKDEMDLKHEAFKRRFHSSGMFREG